MRNSIWIGLTISVLILACKKDDTNPSNNTNNNPPEATLSSSLFADSGIMPQELGRYHGNASPDLKIETPPSGTVVMVLTMQDVSFNNAWHWTVWNIPVAKTSIAKNEDWAGLNVTVGDCDYGQGYVGPFPPNEHVYKITVYFLKEKLSLAAASYASLPDAMKDKIIAQASLKGRYLP
ncbi:MAG: hypothetical protein GC180_01095 [Bacteroidetes bacterium]|nr:hypothetical protein [Bacteroidota bacterium]